MKYMVSILLTILSLQGICAASNGGRGGGDPYANDFLDMGEQVAGWLSTHPVADVDATKFSKEVASLRESLNDPALPTRIIFQNAEVTCGVPKVGCTEANRTITVHRPDWIQLSQPQRYELVTLEILQLLGMTGRYNIADFISHHSAEIEKQPVAHQIQAPPGVRVKVDSSKSKIKANMECALYHLTMSGSKVIETKSLKKVRSPVFHVGEFQQFVAEFPPPYQVISVAFTHYYTSAIETGVDNYSTSIETDFMSSTSNINQNKSATFEINEKSAGSKITLRDVFSYSENSKLTYQCSINFLN